MYPRGANASFCVVCCVKLYFVFLGPSLVKMFHLCPACNQDVHPSKGKFLCCARLYMYTLYATFILSFGSFLSRCSIFWQGKLFACMCVCLCIVCSTFVLSRCCIFRQLLVKMFHLLVRKVVCMFVCVHVHCVFNFCAVKMLHLSAASCQDVPSFGEESCVCMCVCLCIVCSTFVLSRCCIFRQLLVKMFHLLVRKVVCMFVCVHVHCVFNFCAVKMLHLSAASCQDVPSFGEESCVCMCACMCIVCATFVLSRCCIFRQLLVKMFHLSARKVVFVCVHACALCVQLSCCQDVASFGSFSSRCSIFRRGKLYLYVCMHVHCVCNFHAVKMLHLSAASRQDVPSFGEESCVCMCACMCIVCATFVLSRCCVFWQLLVKMFHLSARKVVFVCVRACALCVQLSCCQDVTSFGSFSSRCFIFRRGKLCFYVCVHVYCVCNFRVVKMLHLSAASRQDVPSFGEESCVCMCVCMCIVCATFVLSRCCIFRQLLVKMFHLLARKVVFVCVCAYALCVQLPYCQDVPSFGEESCVCMCVCICIVCATSILSRCSIFRQLLVKMSCFGSFLSRYPFSVCFTVCAYVLSLSRCSSVSMHRSAAEEVLFYFE